MVIARRAGNRVPQRHWRLCSADTTPCVRHGRRQGTEPCCTVQIHHCVTARREGFGASQRYGDSQAGREPSPTETLTSLQCRYNTVCQAWTEAGYRGGQGTEPRCTVEIHHCVTARRYWDIDGCADESGLLKRPMVVKDGQQGSSLAENSLNLQLAPSGGRRLRSAWHTDTRTLNKTWEKCCLFKVVTFCSLKFYSGITLNWFGVFEHKLHETLLPAVISFIPM